MKTNSWLMVKAVFEGENALIFQELAAQVFADHGIFEVELTEPGATGLVDDRDREYSVTGHLPDNAEGAKTLESLSADLMRLAGNLSASCEISTASRRNEEWSETWKRFFHPIRVTDRLVWRGKILGCAAPPETAPARQASPAPPFRSRSSPAIRKSSEGQACWCWLAFKAPSPPQHRSSINRRAESRLA